MQHIDALIEARWIIPVEPEGEILEGRAIAIHEGKVLDLLDAVTADEKYAPQIRHVLVRHAVLPGLVNAHTHAAMSLFKGLADDLPLMTWLESYIWPAERRWVSDAFVRDGTALAAAEMLRSGTTCFNDMYFFPDEAGKVAADAGLRAVVGLIVVDAPTVWARSADDYFAKGTDVHDQFKSHPLISTAFAPHAPYTVADGALERVRVLAEELDIPIHMHVHETADEVRRATETTGERPLARLARLGMISPRLLAVHMTQLEGEEIARLREAGAHVVHCPESNLKLASGFCPVQTLIEAGVNVALGTDGAASNNDLDLIGEMRTAAYLAKGVCGQAAAVPARTALTMATLGGARALGLEELIGSIRPGKAADLIAVDLDTIETAPLYDPIAQIVYACSRHQVSDVWVAGRHLLKERSLTTMDEEALLATARRWRQRIGGAR